MRPSLRLLAALGLSAVAALPSLAQDRPARAERADTVELKIGRRIQIVRAPGTDRQQRIQITRGGDTTDVRLDVNPEALEGWMRRILILDDDSTEAAPADTAPPVRIRMRNRRGDRPERERPQQGSRERILEFRTPDGQVRRDTLRDGQPAPDGFFSDDAVTMEIERIDTDGARHDGRRSALWVERIEDGEQLGGRVIVLRDGERPGEDVRVRRGERVEEQEIRVTRDGDEVRIERGGDAHTLRLRRTPETRRDGTLVVPDGKGGTWIYLPPRGQ